MLHFMGDVHGHWAGILELDRLLQQRPDASEHVIIQVGDFGWDANLLKNWREIKTPVYALDGNHENFNDIREFNRLAPMVDGAVQPLEILPNLYYVPRGCILHLDGLRIGCAGGAGSVDAFWRRRGVTWWPDDEVLSKQQVGQLWTAPVDVLVTHTPPGSIIRANWPRLNTEYWNLPYGWVDPSANVVDELWLAQVTLTGGYVPLFCGHMHKTVVDGTCYVLDISEIQQLESQKP